jgi:hypothetical protein
LAGHLTTLSFAACAEAVFQLNQLLRTHSAARVTGELLRRQLMASVRRAGTYKVREASNSMPQVALDVWRRSRYKWWSSHAPCRRCRPGHTIPLLDDLLHHEVDVADPEADGSFVSLSPGIGLARSFPPPPVHRQLYYRSMLRACACAVLIPFFGALMLVPPRALSTANTSFEDQPSELHRQHREKRLVVPLGVVCRPARWADRR